VFIGRIKNNQRTEYPYIYIHNFKPFFQSSKLKAQSSKLKAQSFFVFNRRLLLTTLTELKAIAAPAIIGFNKKPLIGNKMPAAIGIPITL
jgi:hypothetical protein